jgi:hypothetical protein
MRAGARVLEFSRETSQLLGVRSRFRTVQLFGVRSRLGTVQLFGVRSRFRTVIDPECAVMNEIGL